MKTLTTLFTAVIFLGALAPSLRADEAEALVPAAAAIIPTQRRPSINSRVTNS